MSKWVGESENTPEDAKPVIFGTGFDGGITDLQVGPDGYLYVLTFAGAIYSRLCSAYI
jgi:aldose sugar dehydrogenase